MRLFDVRTLDKEAIDLAHALGGSRISEQVIAFNRTHSEVKITVKNRDSDTGYSSAERLAVCGNIGRDAGIFPGSDPVHDR